MFAFFSFGGGVKQVDGESLHKKIDKWYIHQDICVPDHIDAKTMVNMSCSFFFSSSFRVVSDVAVNEKADEKIS